MKTELLMKTRTDSTVSRFEFWKLTIDILPVDFYWKDDRHRMKTTLSIEGKDQIFLSFSHFLSFSDASKLRIKWQKHSFISRWTRWKTESKHNKRLKITNRHDRHATITRALFSLTINTQKTFDVLSTTITIRQFQQNPMKMIRSNLNSEEFVLVRPLISTKFDFYHQIENSIWNRGATIVKSFQKKRTRRKNNNKSKRNWSRHLIGQIYDDRLIFQRPLHWQSYFSWEVAIIRYRSFILSNSWSILVRWKLFVPSVAVQHWLEAFDRRKSRFFISTSRRFSTSNVVFFFRLKKETIWIWIGFY